MYYHRWAVAGEAGLVTRLVYCSCDQQVRRLEAGRDIFIETRIGVAVAGSRNKENGRGGTHGFLKAAPYNFKPFTCRLFSLVRVFADPAAFHGSFNTLDSIHPTHI